MPELQTYADLGDTPPAACDCDGGWRWVQLPYAEHLAAKPDGTVDHATLAAFLNSVYPCRTCHPAAFYRWAEGHFARDHDAAACDDCRDAAKGRRRSIGRPASPARPSDPPIGEPPPDADPVWGDA